MIGGFSKYTGVLILLVVITSMIILLIVCKCKRKYLGKKRVMENEIDVNRTLDLEECAGIVGNNTQNMGDEMFEIEYELTFIHTDEIII